MTKILIFLILSLYCFLYPTSTEAEKIKSHFNRLPLMREKAIKDREKRAVDNIDYISKTSNGKYFEVDNINPPIEAVIYKINKTRQFKPLRETKDEELIIRYFKKVDGYAESYYKIIASIITESAKPKQIVSSLEKLNKTYPDFGATYRALGAFNLASDKSDKAISYAEKAASLNKDDPKALLMLSIGKYARGMKGASSQHFSDAKKIDPNVTKTSWEFKYVVTKIPKTCYKWSKDMNL